MTDTAPDVNGLINLLNALAIDFECDDKHDAKETCDKAATALSTLLESNAALERERTNLIETKREQIGRLQKERDEQRKRADTLAQQNAYHKDRAEAAEAKLAEAMKALDALDRVNRGVDWCDQYEQARRWFAARKFLKENGNGE